ncbi:hypothetical protein BaRGS_00031782, partial [Batillaria attramentaria]
SYFLHTSQYDIPHDADGGYHQYKSASTERHRGHCEGDVCIALCLFIPSSDDPLVNQDAGVSQSSSSKQMDVTSG